MKKKWNKIISIFLTSVVLLATSCKKETDEFVPYTNSDFNDTEWTSIAMTDAKAKAITDALANPIISTTFNSSTNNTLDIDKKTQLYFNANSLQLNGADYSGNATAKVSKLFTKGDFVRNLMSSTSTSPMYETIAAYNLNIINSNQQNLTVKQASKINVNSADSFPGVGYIYTYGVNTTNKDVTWAVADPSIGNLQIANVTVQGANTLAYQINTNKLGFMSVSKPLSFNTTTTCNVILPINFTNKNTAVFAIFNDYNAVVKLSSNVNSKTFELTNAPINERIILVALSYLDGNFYLGYSHNTISSNAQYNIKTSATPISLSNLNTFLNSL